MCWENAALRRNVGAGFSRDLPSPFKRARFLKADGAVADSSVITGAAWRRSDLPDLQLASAQPSSRSEFKPLPAP